LDCFLPDGYRDRSNSVDFGAVHLGEVIDQRSLNSYSHFLVGVEVVLRQRLHNLQDLLASAIVGLFSEDVDE
jgi:hypothetical protein